VSQLLGVGEKKVKLTKITKSNRKDEHTKKKKEGRGNRSRERLNS